MTFANSSSRARRLPDSAPLGEVDGGEIRDVRGWGVPGAPRRQARNASRASGTPRASLDYATARAYWARFGGGASHGRWASSWEDDAQTGRRHYFEPSWTTVQRSPEDWEVALGLQRGTVRLAPRGIDETRLLVVDVDVHAEPPAEIANAKPPRKRAPKVVRRIADVMHSAQALARYRNKRALAWRAEIARPVLDRLREVGVFELVERTPRGWHLVVLLDRAIPVAEAAALASHVAAGAGELPPGVAVEAFPKLRADGHGDMCSLPLLGPHRRVGADHVSVGRKRASDVEDLLRAEGLDPEDLRAALEGTAPAPPVSSASRGDETEVSRAPAAEDGRLLKGAFVTRVLDLLEHTGAGESYEAVRRIVAAALYAGHSDEETLGIVRAWSERPTHAAAHCLTPRGRKQLLAVARNGVRHFARGEAAGRCYRGGLKSTELRAAFRQLLAESNCARHSVRQEPRPCAENSTSNRARAVATSRTSAAAGARPSTAASTRTSCPTSGSSPPSAATSRPGTAGYTVSTPTSSSRACPTRAARSSRTESWSSAWPDGHPANDNGPPRELEFANTPAAVLLHPLVRDAVAELGAEHLRVMHAGGRS